MRNCFNCEIKLSTHQYKYCSLRCQFDFQHKNWIENWKQGKVSGDVGISTKFTSGHIKRYLREKFENRCVSCGWNEKNPITGIIPLEIDHIDGNSENNTEVNLRLLCPNCHALTPFYKNMNRGNGRQWRMKKYIKNIDSKSEVPVVTYD